MKVIVVDCGSTQATAAVFDRPGTEESIRYVPLPHGVNAVTAAEGEFRAMGEALGSSEEVGEVYFYGAGCASKEICDRVEKELREVFSRASTVEVATDMLAAARALCGDERGIVAILGTGSNSCLYDGKLIVANVSPLGYILGDEGSGAVLGRLFLGRVLKRQFPEEVLQRFSSFYPGVTGPEVITRVYRSERPNAYLASFCPFIGKCLDIPEVEMFVIEEFRRFIKYNLSHYLSFSRTDTANPLESESFIRDNDLSVGTDQLSNDIKVHFTGSIAYHFADQLRKALIEDYQPSTDSRSVALSIGKILRSPLPSLAVFHLRHSQL